MLREQLINWLEAAVILLALTNAFSAVVVAYTVRLARSLVRAESAMPEPDGLLSSMAKRLWTSSDANLRAITTKLRQP